MTTYAINYYFGKLDPLSYHMVNLSLHIGSSYLIFLIVGSISSSSMASIMAGLLFLVHPFNSEIINYISSRSSVMSGFFYLLSFYCWIRFRRTEDYPGFIGGGRRGFYISSILSFGAAMLSKEIAITLPVALWTYDIYFGDKGKEGILDRIANPRSYIPYLPFILLVSLPYLFVKASFVSKSLSHSERGPLTQLFTEFPIIFKHWRMFLVPYPLTLIHDDRIYNTPSLPVLFSLFFILVYAAVAIYLFSVPSHKGRIVSFFMIWFFIVLAPTTIMPLGLIFQEHRGYLACVSFVVIAGLVVEGVKRTLLSTIGVAILVIMVLIYSAVTIDRNRTWRDDLTLWGDTVQKSPGSSTALTGLGIAYKDHKMYNRAEELLKRAISLGGHDIDTARRHLAHLYIIQNRWDLAARELEISLKNNREDPQLYSDLGIVYANMGKKDMAERIFKQAVRMDPTDYLPFFNLGVFYMNEGRKEEALQVLEKAVSLSPGHLESRLRLGILLEEVGRKSAAADHYRIILEQSEDQKSPIVREARGRLQRM